MYYHAKIKGQKKTTLSGYQKKVLVRDNSIVMRIRFRKKCIMRITSGIMNVAHYQIKLRAK